MLLVSFFLLAMPCAPLPQQDPGEMIASVRPGGWKVIGPFAPGTIRYKGPRAAATKMTAGEPWAALRDTFIGVKRTELQWTAPDIESLLRVADRQEANPRSRLLLDSGALDLRTILASQGTAPDNASGAVIYLYRPVFATTASTMAISCGVIGRATMWWNGKAVVKSHEDNRLMPDSIELTVDVQPGINHLLIEVVDEHAEWKFELRSKRHLDSARIHRAIRLGVDYLLDTQLIDGSWLPHGQHVNGTTALAVYTLVKSGESPRCEAVLKGLSFLRQARAQGTYSVALELMAFEAGGDPQDAELIESIAQRLIKGQLGSGMWSYFLNGGGGSGGDLSNTQYAALGLRAAVKSGVQVPNQTWTSLAQAVLSCRNSGSSKFSSTGAYGFGYSIGSRSPSHSMTAAGIGTLAICAENMSSRNSSTTPERTANAIDAGIRWLDRHWDLGRGPVSMNNFYFLYGLERAGGLADRQVFGTHDWYDEGAKRIVQLQFDNGRWDSLPAPIVECFALLFLRRATSRHAFTNINLANDYLRKSSLTDGPLLLRLSLVATHSIWIDRNTEGFDDIARVVYWLQPPGRQWQRVEEMFENSFAIQYDMAIPGDWKVRASAQLTDGRLLTSGTIEFTQRKGISADRLAYVTEGFANLVPSGRPKVSASSSAPYSSSKAMVDGNYATSWRCADDDESPEIEFELGGRSKAETLKLVLAPREMNAFHGAPQPSRVEVTINDRPPVLLLIPSYLHEKAVLEFDEKITVKKIKLRILSLSEGQLGQASIGFAEVELY